jgi:cation transport ATPase
VKPLELQPQAKAPRKLYISSLLWLVSAVLALPTAIFAATRFDKLSTNLFAQMNPKPEQVEQARSLADKAPIVVTAAVLVVVVLQLVFVGLMITKRSRGSRAALMLLGVLGTLLLLTWRTILFAESAWVFEATLVVQIVLTLAAIFTMFGKTQNEWFDGGTEPVRVKRTPRL